MAEIGTILGGRYRVLAPLGQGGMATIYRALDTQLGREVALKLLRPEYLRDPDFSSRFRQEAQSAASLSHPNVVTVYDYGEDPSGPFIVMELVDGEDLASIMRRNGPLPPAQAARIAAAVARALAAAHGRGLVHRDVKPGNVLIGRDGRVKVVDFGIARAIAEAQMTMPGTTLGSVHYFSPEQARGEPATTASDIFALGIVLYEMLTGSRPWEGDSAASVALARLTGPAPDPLRIRPGVPPAIALVATTAMARSPMERYPSAGLMADALEATLPGSSAGHAATASGGAASGGGASGGGAAGGAAAGGTTAGAGLAAAGAGLAASSGSARVSGVARSNPTVVSYAPEAYAGMDDPSDRDDEPARRRAIVDDDDRDGGTSPMVWIAGLLAVVLLAVIAFFVFQLLSGPQQPTDPSEVTVPNFVGKLLAAATVEADELGIELVSTPDSTSDQPPGVILKQDPLEGATVAPGARIQVTVAAGLTQVPAPDLRRKTEAQAVAELVSMGLRPGLKTEAFDPVVPAGLVVAQVPNAGVLMVRDAAVDYVMSKGPEPTPTPTPSPTASPTPEPTLAPEPTPTAPPTPEPTVPPTPEPSILPIESLPPT